MPQQLSFAGLEATPRPTDCIFFAIFPDAQAATRIASLARSLRDKHGLKNRPLAAKRFHISLHHVGDYAGVPEGAIAAARDTASTVAMPPFRIALDCAKSLGRGGHDRPLALTGGDGVAGLERFQHMLGRTMEQAGLGRWIGPSWLPHLTLLYGDRGIEEEPIEPVSWTVREFVLVHSLLGRTQHIPLARWPLRS